MELLDRIKASPSLWLVVQVVFWLLVVVAVLLTALANLTLPVDVALANPRLASAVVFARKVAPVLRGALKPLLGIFLPKVAAEVVSEMLGGAPTSSSSPATSDPEKTP